MSPPLPRESVSSSIGIFPHFPTQNSAVVLWTPGEWVKHGCTRLQITSLLCHGSKNKKISSGKGCVSHGWPKKYYQFCTNHLNCVIIQMHICRKPRIHVLPTGQLIEWWGRWQTYLSEFLICRFSWRILRFFQAIISPKMAEEDGRKSIRFPNT